MSTRPLLQAHDVSVTYPGASSPSVSDVSLSIAPGAAIGIVGESGSGKTTLAHLLTGLLRPSEGRVEVDGSDWRTVGCKDPRRRRVQMIFQDPFGALNPDLSIVSAVAEVYVSSGRMKRAAARAAAAELLAEVGVPRTVHSSRPRELSGGQCQRVGIARAVASDPDVLIADEPTSALDISVQAQILNLLTRLRASRDLAIVVVSHDLGVIAHATDEILVMHRGRVVERGSTVEVLTAPQHDYTASLVASTRTPS